MVSGLCNTPHGHSDEQQELWTVIRLGCVCIHREDINRLG